MCIRDRAITEGTSKTPLSNVAVGEATGFAALPTDRVIISKGGYLKFRITNGNQATDDLALDGEAGCAAVIDTFRVVNSVGSVLEEIVHYNSAYALMNGMVSDNHRIVYGYYRRNE